MAIRKRGNSYQIDYIDPNGKRVRQSFKKRKEAEAELGKRVSLIAENPKRYLEIAKASLLRFDRCETDFTIVVSFSDSVQTFVLTFGS